MKHLLLVLVCSLFAGCAFQPQTANIAPTVSVMASQEGKGITVGVRVVDERPSKSLGRRGTAYGAAAEITAAQDLAVVVANEIRTALQQKGFAVADYSESTNPRLHVEVRLLEYSTSVGFWTGGVQIQGALKAVVRNGDKTYEKMYRSDTEERVVVVPDASTNEQWINRALSDVLQQLLSDPALVAALKG